ncbi:hypothetical protein [Deinococcus koreensis]|uniref:Uncharacterized protein n=1 Tax=Deinococcus koreensis TaxID=2054903 RepID=A0A2K3V1U6_9DEIO|nr:hypothetical protein [Deinococcus koreensis]PNY82745.1 hypothetical protein CVO96_16535 [Deinococcus koreensis]
MTLHPATQRAQLQFLFREVPVVTTVQLHRLGLLRAAGSLTLPERTRDCVTRVTQQRSVTRLSFVALKASTLQRPAQVLQHLAGVAEARLQLGELAPGERFSLIATRGRPSGNQPDAELLLGGPSGYQDQALEFDAGYPKLRVDEKLRAFAEQGYTGILWATSVHGRVETLFQRMRDLRAAGELPGVERCQVTFVDFWTAHRDPYGHRPRCHKPFVRSSY